MIQIDNFLVIFSLEVGGKFIGLFTLITNAILFPLSILLLIFICVDVKLEILRDQLENLDMVDVMKLKWEDETAVKHLREYLIVTFILFVIISGIYLIASSLLIRGTKNVRRKNSRKT